MTVLRALDWEAVRRQYDLRVAAHQELVALFDGTNSERFAQFALGIVRKEANYSAAEHALGPKVRAENQNADARLKRLAEQFADLPNGRLVPLKVHDANLKYLKIAVGSELACMMNPTRCWVTNVRTVWTDLVIKHNDNVALANEQLQLYERSEATPGMDYEVWSDLNGELDVALTRISDDGAARAYEAGVEPGSIKYLWADSIANTLFDSLRPRRRSRR